MLRTHFITVALAGAAAWLLQGCAGPPSLDQAIRPGDEAAYRTLVSGGQTPGEAFLRDKARTQQISLQDARAHDEALSVSDNPFSRRSDPGAVSRGAVIYKNECMACHGEHADGRGPQMPVTLASMDFHRTAIRMDITMRGGAVKKWFGIIQNGTTAVATAPDGSPLAVTMPSFGARLAREQIWLVITYLQSLNADIPAHDTTGHE